MGPHMLRLLAIVALLGACGRDGALEQVDFAPECAPGDLACQGGGIDRPLAVGAVLPLDVSSAVPGSVALGIELAVADPSVLKVSGHELTGLAEGRSALVAVTDGDMALDFTHVWVVRASRIAIRRRLDPDEQTIEAPIQLLVGDELTLDVAAYAQGARLAGRLAVDWSTSSEALSLLEDGTIGTRRVVARAPGASEIVATWDEHEARITVEVLP